MQVERVVYSLVLGTYVSVLNDMVDQALACADSGQMWDSPVVAELFATLTRHALAQRWSGPSQASRSVARHTWRNGRVRLLLVLFRWRSMPRCFDRLIMPSRHPLSPVVLPMRHWKMLRQRSGRVGRKA